MASLESGVGYLKLDTGFSANVPGAQLGTTAVCSTYTRTVHHLQNMHRN